MKTHNLHHAIGVALSIPFLGVVFGMAGMLVEDPVIDGADANLAGQMYEAKTEKEIIEHAMRNLNKMYTHKAQSLKSATSSKGNVGTVFGAAGAFVDEFLKTIDPHAYELHLTQEQQADILDRVRDRASRKEARIAKRKKDGSYVKHVKQTYPMQASALIPSFAHKPAETEIAENIGHLVYKDRKIEISLNRAPRHLWDNQMWTELEDTMQTIMNTMGAAVYPHSPQPGETGNMIIAAHSSPPTFAAKQGIWGRAFRPLFEAEIGERFEIHDTKGMVHTYEIEHIEVIHPTKVSILEQPTDGQYVTLFTCYPDNSTAQRIHAVGKLVTSVAANNTQVTINR